MTVQIDYSLGLSGLAIGGIAYADTSGDVAGIPVTFAENIHRLGYYSATTTLPSGLYWIQISQGSSFFDSQWVLIPAAGRVTLVPSQFDANNQVNLAAGAIDLQQLTPTLKALLVRGYLITTATTNPATADVWCTGRFYNNTPTYQSFASNLYAWNNGTSWVISSAIGINGAAYWMTSPGTNVTGPFVPQGTATGTFSAAAHGNAVAAAFQPDQTFLTAAQVATIPTTGSIAKSTDIPTSVQNRQEMDANSTKLANLDATVSSRLPTAAYEAAPSPSAIAAGVASVLFVDGTANSLKVNDDHTASISMNSLVIDNFVTIPPAVANASQNPAMIVCLRGDTLRVTLPLMGNLSTRTKLVMTAKVSTSNTDDQAILQIVEGTGITRLNGEVSLMPSLASLTVTDAATGTVNLWIDSSITALFAVQDLVWDAQAYLSTGIVSPIGGVLSVAADVTQSVT